MEHYHIMELRSAQSAFEESSRPLPIDGKVVKRRKKLTAEEKRRKHIIHCIESNIKLRCHFANFNFNEELEEEDRKWLESRNYRVAQLIMYGRPYWTISWDPNDPRLVSIPFTL